MSNLVRLLNIASSQKGDIRLSDSPSGQSNGGEARTRDKRVPADLRADSLATVPPTLHLVLKEIVKEKEYENDVEKKMSDRSTQTKESILDYMYETFCANSKAYVSAVKAALRSHRKHNTAEIFQRAIDILSQDFPDPTSIHGETKEETATAATATAGTAATATAGTAATATAGTAATATAGTAAATAAAGTTATAAVTPPPTAATASAISRPLKGVRQRTKFIAKVAKDQYTSDIEDVQLLPGGRILLADWRNEYVKLFDTQGQHLSSLQCTNRPFRLAVLDSSGDSKKLQMSRQYYAVAAVNKLSLAAAYWRFGHHGIDQIDLDGRVLRQICLKAMAKGSLRFSTDLDLIRPSTDTATNARPQFIARVRSRLGEKYTSSLTWCLGGYPRQITWIA
ncbi:hypothetical protein PoB_005517900 [Plakobranchus ocellatus]|uniref:Uncharacterized protein n=1 Tax=Plakobranchus ocellatus TaxID=259542 RepID=A0AAV4CC31_9GAST|nr:hypothetical protein PoB_005517900 [Plakobranchus ocellatus]